MPRSGSRSVRLAPLMTSGHLYLSRSSVSHRSERDLSSKTEPSMSPNANISPITHHARGSLSSIPCDSESPSRFPPNAQHRGLGSAADAVCLNHFERMTSDTVRGPPSKISKWAVRVGLTYPTVLPDEVYVKRELVCTSCLENVVCVRMTHARACMCQCRVDVDMNVLW